MVEEMTRYTAVCRRSGDWWAITVPGLKGVHSQAKRLEQVEETVREAISLYLEAKGEESGPFEIEVRPEVPDEVSTALKAREEAAQAEERANRATIDAVHVLLGSGLTVRDAGRLLHLSPQRISQLTGSPAAKTARQALIGTSGFKVYSKKSGDHIKTFGTGSERTGARAS